MNANDHRQVLPGILDFPRVGGTPGRPEERADEAYADRGYDREPRQALRRWPGITPQIAKRKTPHGSGPGRSRRVAGPTIAWLEGLRRLRVRYDRLGLILDAWETLAASVIGFRIVHRGVS